MYSNIKLTKVVEATRINLSILREEIKRINTSLEQILRLVEDNQHKIEKEIETPTKK